ncbi:O81 family O-antigen flippase [Pseudocitrobacter faecalis]|uniref:O81 family O-antigen flippase n=1 Tax=Pseudocitrobacter faecalis TaxID=1398493 RepID=UPI00389AB15D
MKHYKDYRVISLLSICMSALRIIVGPITLLVLAKKMTSEELGFYYTFFSLTAMTQLLEVGMTGVLRQYYSHSHDKKDCKQKLSNYFIFSIYWYLALSFLFFIIGTVVPFIMYKDYQGDIQWKNSWFLLLSVSCITLLLLPINAMLDGTQRQKLLIKANIISQLSVAVSLWFFIYAGCKLYALGLSQFMGIFAFLISIFVLNKFSWRLLELNYKSFHFNSVLVELWPLLKKTSIVWFLGYFYWNGFNILSFKYLGAEVAGLIGISIALMRAGQNISISVLNSQMTLYANSIAKGLVDESKRTFRKYFVFSFSMLLCGYGIFYLLYYIFPSFFLFKKILPFNQLIFISIFFIFTFLISGFEAFTRCFKVEKFIFTQLMNSILTPFLFWLGIVFKLKYFLLPIISVAIVMLMTIYISKKFYKGYMNEEGI